MKTSYINKAKKIALKSILIVLPLGGLSVGLTSCSDMLDTSSDMVEYAKDNTLSTPEDSLYSVMGIIRSMQNIGDRTVLLGELRGDLMVTTDAATTDLKDLANFNVQDGNQYNKISDYYAIINNCNYFIANADTALAKLGKKIFEKEFAAVKTYRAWTYLQLAKIYGNVPLVLDPVLTESDAEKEMNKSYSDVNAICNYFIDDIKPYVDTDLPEYGEINGLESKKFYIPVRVLLGEMCLWAGRYQEAAEYLCAYLTKKNDTQPTYTTQASIYTSDYNFASFNIRVYDFSKASDVENITILPMETSEFYGVKSMLENVYNSTEYNYYYFQATPSAGLYNLSKNQTCVYLMQTSDTQKDTIYVPKTLNRPEYIGDLRYGTQYSHSVQGQDETSKYSSNRQSLSKVSDNFIGLYRRQQIYLMYAEALCRAGYPESAFCILKYGLRNQNIEKYVSQQERERAGSLLSFNDDDFTERNTLGIHARGCCDVDCDTTYCLPMPLQALASYNDTIEYQIPLLEDMIIDEMALEETYEGRRYYDLMRVALRRNAPSYLARPISRRNGTDDSALYTLLMNKDNWYLPIK